MKPRFEESRRQVLYFRAKITSMGDKVHIIIPKAYHIDAEYFKDKNVDVKVSPVEKLGNKVSRIMPDFKAKITSMGDKVHIIIPKAYHIDAEYFSNKYVRVLVVEILENFQWVTPTRAKWTDQ
jgi:hypothetical protein